MRTRQLLSNLGRVSVRANGQLALELFEVYLSQVPELFLLWSMRR